MWSLLVVDNGKSGHLCLYTPLTGEVSLCKVPLRVGKLSTRVLHREVDEAHMDYDWLEMQRLVTRAVELSNNAVVGFIEEPAAGKKFGSDSRSIQDNFRALGLWQAAMHSNGIEPYTINPTSWKQKLGLRGKPKAAVLDFVKSIKPDGVFPTVDAADAFAIAYYASRYLPDFSFVWDEADV